MNTNAIRFAAGFIAGIFDGLGMIRSRNRILDCVAHTGATMDGFDRAADLFLGDR